MQSRRWLPHPTMSLMLFLMWLLLFNSLAPLVLVSGFFLSWFLPIVTRMFWTEVPHVKHSGKLLRYMLMVLGDIVIANMVALKLILGPRRNLHPAWVEVPLDIRDPYAITILASTISLTPGTVTTEVGPGHGKLLIHALNALDPDALVADIKQRYEAPLKEIFE